MKRVGTERLIIRDIEDSDLPAMLELYSGEDNMRYISTGKFQWTIDELKLKLGLNSEAYPEGYGVFLVEIKTNRAFIGEGSLFNSFNDRSVLELGYIVDKKWTGKGFGTEICRGLIQYAFEVLSVKRVIARVHSENKRSINVVLKAGMAFTGSGKTMDGRNFDVFEVLACRSNE